MLAANAQNCSVDVKNLVHFEVDAFVAVNTYYAC